MEIAKHGSDSDALRAIESLWNRIYGKPTEHVEVEEKEPETLEALDSMTREERKQLLRQLEEQGRLRLVRQDATD